MALVGTQRLELSPKGKAWQIVDFEITNSTASPVTMNLFDVNTPTTVPTGIINPSYYPTTLGSAITVGTSPRGIAYNSLNNTMYVTNHGGTTVSVINCTTNAVVATITVGNSPRGIAYNSADNTMYVTLYFDGEVVVIDCETNTVTGSPITVGSAVIPDIVYNSVDNTMYVSNNGSADISVIDCDTNTVTATIALSFSPNIIAYNSYSNTIYVPDATDITIISCSTNSILSTISSVATNISYIEYNSTNNTMYVADDVADDVVVIDCSTNTISGSPISVGTTPNSLKFNSINNCIYVTNSGSTNIYIINCVTNAVVSPTITMATTPFAIEFDSVDNRMYVINTANAAFPITAPAPPIYITSGSINYNQFVRDLAVNPKRMKQMVLITSSTQLVKPLTFSFTNMVGKTYYAPRHPNLSITQHMPQNTIAAIDLNPEEVESVLDEHTFISDYTILGNTTVTMIIYFKELVRDHLLNITGSAELNTCEGLSLPNCSESNEDKMESELVDFGEYVITIDEVINIKNIARK